MEAFLAPLPSAGRSADFPTRFCYRLEFQRSSDGRRLDAGLIDPSWIDVLSEQAIFQAQRKGAVGCDPSTATIREHPLFAEDEHGPLKGMLVSAGQGDQSQATPFELTAAFSAPAELAHKKLVESGLLTGDQKATFQVYAAPLETTVEAAQSLASQPVRTTVKRAPLPLFDGQLSDHLDGAELCGEMHELDHPIFLPRTLFDRAREYCFKTGRQEGGAMITARTFHQTHPRHEIYAVAQGVIELRHAKQSLFGFEPTSETFGDLNVQLHLRRTRLGFSDEMPAVLVHNHPFEPSVRDDGVANCPTCPLQPTCQLTSSFYSTSDVNFHLSTYSRLPFVAGIVIGLTPRAEDDVRMFCLEGTRVRERGFYWVD